jgi:hypothetical protein
LDQHIERLRLAHALGYTDLGDHLDQQALSLLRDGVLQTALPLRFLFSATLGSNLGNQAVSLLPVVLGNAVCAGAPNGGRR